MNKHKNPVIRRWDRENRALGDPVNIPDDWKIVVSTYDMEEPCNCPSCGIKTEFGAMYTSREMFVGSGAIAACVCPECHDEENEREMAFLRRIREMGRVKE